MTLNKIIDYRFKILYAVGMIMVVCSHTRGGGISIVSDWFPYGGLNLALFAFSSGYFYKSYFEKNAGKYIIKKVKSLLIPLYIYTIVYGVIVQITKLKGFEIGGSFTIYNLLIAPITNGHQFVYNMGGWFIVPLFMVEVYNICMRKVLKMLNKNMPELVFSIVSIILGLKGNQLACLGYLNGWWLVLVRMSYFIPFYEMGILYKNELEKYEHMIPSFWYFSVIFLIKLIIAYIYGRMPFYTPSWCNNFTEGPLMPIIIGYLEIAFWMRLASLLEPIIGRSKWVNLIADNTYSIMMNQFLGFMLVKSVFGVINKINLAFEDFDWVSYKKDIWWYYKPKGLNHMLILYAVTGIVFSIIVQKIVDFVKGGIVIIYHTINVLQSNNIGLPCKNYKENQTKTVV